MKYVSGRNNLAATIFVPFPCGNHCPFCNTAPMYDGYEYQPECLEKMLDSIRLCNGVDAISEFVITGGEPIMELDVLKEIIDACEKPVFINTSLPAVRDLDEVIDYFNHNDKIRGINISRHIGQEHSVAVASKDVIDRIEKPIRINCLVLDSMLGDRLLEYIDIWTGAYRMVNLRADYRNITYDTLKNRDKVSNWLLDHFRYEGSNNCLVCNSEFFSDDDCKVVCYHRGMQFSSVRTSHYTYINDVIIDIYGDIHQDWPAVWPTGPHIEWLRDDGEKFIQALKNNKLS